MRVLLAAALLSFAMIVMPLPLAMIVMPASAADLVVPHGDFAPDGAWSGGVRAGQVTIFDYEPGVIVRPYWLAPWHNRHYFPTAGRAPAVGRLEDLSATGAVPQPAETFYRAWSTNDLYPRRLLPRVRARAIDDEGVRGGRPAPVMKP
jgi:hypothetical protein